MLNEFKRSIWNDGYSKEQPWLNYYNSYERMHCCFGDDGGDGASDAEDSGMTAAQAAEVAAAMDAAKAGNLSSEAQQAAGDAVAAEQQGIGINEVDSGLGGANVSMQEIDALEDLDLIGYNERDALGYFDKLDAQSRANDQRIADEIVENQSALGRDVNVTLDKEGNFVYEGADAFTAALGEIGKGASYLSQNIGIGSAISAAARALGIAPEEVTQEDINKTQDYSMNRAKESPLEAAAYAAGQRTADPYRDGIAGPAINPTGIGAAYAAQPPEDPVAVQRSYADAMLGVRETRGGPSIDLTDAMLEVAYREEAQKADAARDAQIDREYNIGLDQRANQGYGGLDRASYNSVVNAALGGQGFKDFNLGLDQRANQDYGEARQDMSYGQGDLGANFGGFEYGLGADFMPGPGQPGYGGAALGGMTDAELQAAYAEEGRNMSSAIQPDVLGVRNVDSAENIFKEIIKKPEEKAEVVPKTPMEKYFAERGTPAIPSSFQEYRSYLPPIGPAANADYRRTLALGTPRYQEPSGPNRSIATLAAAYGMTYDEAAKRFAPPSVPAMGGGGLRGLMEYS